MASLSFRLDLTMLRTAHNNFEVLEEVRLIITYTIRDEMCPDTWDEMGSNFFQILDPKPFLQGEETAQWTSGLINTLLYFAVDEQFATHSSMLGFLPLFGKIIKDFNDEADSGKCTHMIEECYGVLECVAQHPTGLEAIIKSNVPESLCFAAGSLRFGCQRAEKLLVSITEVRGDAMWNDGNSHVLNHLILKYTESIDTYLSKDDDNVRKWDMLNTVYILLTRVNGNAIKEHAEWSCKLQNVIAKLFSHTLSEDHRDLVFYVAVWLIQEYGIQWTLQNETNCIFLEKLVRLACVHISVAVMGKTYEAVLCLKTHLTCCCALLLLIFLNGDKMENIQQVSFTNFCDIMKLAVRAICDFFILMDDAMISNTENKNTHDNQDRKEHKPNELAAKSNTELSSAEKSSSCKTTCPAGIQEFVIDFSYVLALWFNVTHPIDEDTMKKVIAIQRYLLHVSGYLIKEYEKLRRVSEQEEYTVEKQYLQMLIQVFIKLMESNQLQVDDCFMLEHLPELLGNFILLNWADFKKTQKHMSIQTRASQQHLHSSRNVSINKLCNTMAKSKTLFEMQTRSISFAISTMTSRFLIISEGVMYVVTDETKRQMHRFAITNLPYLETNKEQWTEMAYNVMTMGLTLSKVLGVNRSSSDTMQLFFESCVNLLSETHELQGKGRKAVVAVKPQFQQFEFKNVTFLWSKSMVALEHCITIFPQLSLLMLETEWINDILEMLQEVESHRIEGEQRLCFE